MLRPFGSWSAKYGFAGSPDAPPGMTQLAVSGEERSTTCRYTDRLSTVKGAARLPSVPGRLDGVGVSAHWYGRQRPHLGQRMHPRRRVHVAPLPQPGVGPAVSSEAEAQAAASAPGTVASTRSLRSLPRLRGGRHRAAKQLPGVVGQPAPHQGRRRRRNTRRHPLPRPGPRAPAGTARRPAPAENTRTAAPPPTRHQYPRPTRRAETAPPQRRNRRKAQAPDMRNPCAKAAHDTVSACMPTAKSCAANQTRRAAT